MGLEVGKWFTPIIGASLSDELTVNTSPSSTAFDENDLMANLHVNLTNWFLGYNGEPRWFEVELIPSLGWKHYYGMPKAEDASQQWINYFGNINTLDVNFNHNNYVSYRAAMSFDFNLSDAWQINVVPAINYFNRFRAHTGRFDLRVGLLYHLNGGNSHLRNFIVDEYYLKSDYDELQTRYDNLLSDNHILINELHKCSESEPKIVEKIVEVKVGEIDEVVIGFECGSTDLSTCLPALKKVADKMKVTNKSIVITGYASVDGNVNSNSLLAEQRADYIAQELIERFNISEDKITIKNGKTTTMYGDEHELNRVAVISFR